MLLLVSWLALFTRAPAPPTLKTGALESVPRLPLVLVLLLPAVTNYQRYHYYGYTVVLALLLKSPLLKPLPFPLPPIPTLPRVSSRAAR